MQSAAIGDLEHGRVRVGVWIGRAGIGGVDSNIMARKVPDQFAARRYGPIFDMRFEPIGVGQNKFLVGWQRREIRGADQGGDDRGQCGRGVAGIFLPSILGRNRPFQDEKGHRATNHRAGIALADAYTFTLQSPS